MPIELKIPAVGESITSVEIGQWLKQAGDPVAKDERVVVIETEKATMDLSSPVSGTLTKIVKAQGESATIGEVIGYFEPGAKATEGKESPRSRDKAAAPEEEKAPSRAPSPLPPRVTEKPTAPQVMPAAERALAERGLRQEEVKATGPGGRLLKEDVLRHIEPGGPEPAPPAGDLAIKGPGQDREEEVVPMTLLRRTLAERLVAAQRTAALLTTFNEIDMSAVIQLRQQYQELFQSKYGVKLGLMSFFVKASIEALKLIPQVNAEIRGTNIVYRNYYDIGVAVGGGKGLVVPVLRNAARLSFADIDRAIADFAGRARENQLKLEELQGGTFTISNGGIYGSLLSTPIINPPQSGILGMHAIQDRPVAVAGNVVIRPMMYVALTYDHRVVDGREAVTFLKRIKEVIENPARMLIEV